MTWSGPVGGSSGGSGAALAANFSTVATGRRDLRVHPPAGGWNGVVSLRPTPGLVSRSGMWDGYPSPVAQMGPMARNVRDLAMLLDVMVGYDPEDPVTALGVGKTEGSYTQVPRPQRAAREPASASCANRSACSPSPDRKTSKKSMRCSRRILRS